MPPTPQPPEVANLPPELANNPQYEVLRELGRGGMGVVYLAKNKLMDRLEVLKVVNKALLDRPGAAERFLREIRSAAKLNHANVVAAYSAVQSGDLLAFAMEYVEGEDLAQLVRTQGPLPVVNACYYVQQAALGLQHAFEKQMVHRDIKPQNLMLAREGKRHIVKVLDFGLAKVTRAKNENTGLTNSGAMLGTPDYIAPEQTLDAATADIRADIYSLGCTLYYLLTGAPPFKGRSLFEVLQAHQSLQAEPLNLVRADVPEELAAVVGKIMAKDPAQRYQTPVEVARALAAFVKPGAKDEARGEGRGASEEGRNAVGSRPAPFTPRPSSLTSPPSPGPRADTPRAAGAQDTMMPLAPEREAAPPVAADTLAASSTKSLGPRRGKKRRSQPWKRSSQRKWLIGGGIAAGVLLLFLLGLWAGGVFRVRTADSTGPPIVPPAPNIPGALEVANSVGMKLVRIPPGKFTMGSPKDEQDRGDDEGPQHQVEITRAFYMGAHEVRIKDFEEFIRSDGYRTEAEKDGQGGFGYNPDLKWHEGRKPKYTWRDPGYTQDPTHSVVNVSWNDAVAFCRWLSGKEGKTYDLPTEAEWEYACRAGTTTRFHSGDADASLQTVCNRADQSLKPLLDPGKTKGRDFAPWDDRYPFTAPAGSFQPNGFGLHDMHGNVWEWCKDWYAKDYYAASAATDPQGPTSGTSRVLRGGSFFSVARDYRAAGRGNDTPAYRVPVVGFRVVLRIP